MKNPENIYDVIILGAGAAGLMSAITAGERGKKVLILEKSNKVGKKILMSGGGKSNFTNLNVEDFNTSWDIIKIPFDGKKFRNFVVLSRYPKFMLWKIMEDYKKYFEFSYDIVVYCDAFLSPDDKYDWSKIYKLSSKVLRTEELYPTANIPNPAFNTYK